MIEEAWRDCLDEQVVCADQQIVLASQNSEFSFNMLVWRISSLGRASELDMVLAARI